MNNSLLLPLCIGRFDLTSSCAIICELTAFATGKVHEAIARPWMVVGPRNGFEQEHQLR
jgi:hypothetical protein